jgi:hypothetical protein
MADKLKFEDVARVGECIKAYDVMPRTGLEYYVVGIVTEVAIIEDTKYFLIDCVYDSFASDERSRVGMKVKVPVEISQFEFDHRIQRV